MEITLKLTADPELMLLLTRAVKALEASGQNVEPFGPVITTSPAFIPLEDTDKARQESDREELYDEEPARVRAEASDLTSQQLQQKVVELTVKRPGLRAQIRELVNDYAPKLSGVPDGKRAELWAKIEELAKEED